MITQELKIRVDKILDEYYLFKDNYASTIQEIYNSLDGIHQVTDAQLTIAVLSWFPDLEYILAERFREASTFGGMTHVNHPRGIAVCQSPNADVDDQGFEGSWINASGTVVFKRNYQPNDFGEKKDSALSSDAICARGV